jgi:hypothetical protein
MLGCAVETCKALLCTLAAVSVGLRLAPMQGMLHIYHNNSTNTCTLSGVSLLLAALVYAQHISMNCQRCFLCMTCTGHTHNYSYCRFAYD